MLNAQESPPRLCVVEAIASPFSKSLLTACPPFLCLVYKYSLKKALSGVEIRLISYHTSRSREKKTDQTNHSTLRIPAFFPDGRTLHAVPEKPHRALQLRHHLIEFPLLGAQARDGAAGADGPFVVS